MVKGGVLEAAFITGYIILSAIKKVIPLPVMFMLVLVNVIIFILTVGSVSNKSTYFTFFRIGIVLWCNSLVANLLRVVNLNIFIPAQIMLYIMLDIILFVAMFNNNSQVCESIEKINLFSNKQKSSKKTNYDVVICKNKETGKEVVMDYNTRRVHFICYGPTGGGKTSQTAKPMILQDVMRKDCGLTVIEPKGDLTSAVYAMGVLFNEEVIYFDPTHPNCPYFNVFDGKEDEVIETVVTTFEMLSSDSSTFFKGQNNNLLRKAIMVIKRIERAYTNPETGISLKPATLITLSELINNTDNKGREMVREFERIPVISEEERIQNLDTKSWFLDDYFADKSKTFENTSGIRTNVANLIQNKYLRKVLNPPNGKSDINFDYLIENNKKIAISTAQGALRKLGSYLGYFIMLTYQSAIFRRPGNENTRSGQFLYVDEFQEYSNPSFVPMLTQGRSYCLGAALFTQARELVSMGGGRDGRGLLEAINANCRTVVLFPGISSSDAKFFSDAFGSEMVKVVRTGETKSKQTLFSNNSRTPTETTQWAEEEKPIYTSTDLTYKPFEEVTYRTLHNNSVQKPGNGVVKWIPKEINDKLEEIVLQYELEKERLIKQAEEEEFLIRNAMYKDFLESRGDYISNEIKGDSLYISDNYSSAPPPTNQSIMSFEIEQEMVIPDFEEFRNEPSTESEINKKEYIGQQEFLYDI